MLCIRFFSVFISLSLFIAPLPLPAIAQEITTTIAQFEADIIEQNPNAAYIDLSKEWSNIAEIISRLSDLDEQNDSLVHELNAHIKKGFSFAEYDAVLETLEYAAIVLQKNHAQLDTADAEKIVTNLDEIITNVTDGSLTRRPTLVIDENIEVFGKATFEKHVQTKQGIHVLGKLRVNKRARFRDNVTIKGNLTVDGDAFFLSNVEIDGPLSVTDLAVANCMENLCVDNLSVVDLVISGSVIGITGTMGATGATGATGVNNRSNWPSGCYRPYWWDWSNGCYRSYGCDWSNR